MYSGLAAVGSSSGRPSFFCLEGNQEVWDAEMVIPGRRKSLRIRSRRCGEDDSGSSSLPRSRLDREPQRLVVAANPPPYSPETQRYPSPSHVNLASLLPSRASPDLYEHNAQPPASPCEVSSQLDCLEPETTQPNHDLRNEFCAVSPSKLTTTNESRDQPIGAIEKRCEHRDAPSLSSVLVRLFTSSPSGDVKGMLSTALLLAVDGLPHDNEDTANRLLACISKLSCMANAYLLALHPGPAATGSRRVRLSCLSPPRDGDASSLRGLARAAQVMRALLMLCLELLGFKGVAARLAVCSTSDEYQGRLVEGLRSSEKRQICSSPELIDGLQRFLCCFCGVSMADPLPAPSITGLRQDFVHTLDSLTRALLRRLLDESPVPRASLRQSMMRRPSLCNIIVVTEPRHTTHKKPLRNDFPATDEMTPSALFAQALKQLWDLYHLFSEFVWQDEESYHTMHSALQSNVEKTINYGSPSKLFITAKVLVGACQAREFINRVLQATYKKEDRVALQIAEKFWENEWRLLDAADVWNCVESLSQEIIR